jgi:hypothetical protein
MSEPRRPPTAGQQRFVEEHLVDANASRAARAAGHAAASAASIGSDLPAMPAVRAAIAARQAKRSAESRAPSEISGNLMAKPPAGVGEAELSKFRILPYSRPCLR